MLAGRQASQAGGANKIRVLAPKHKVLQVEKQIVRGGPWGGDIEGFLRNNKKQFKTPTVGRRIDDLRIN